MSFANVVIHRGLNESSLLKIKYWKGKMITQTMTYNLREKIKANLNKEKHPREGVNWDFNFFFQTQ